MGESALPNQQHRHSTSQLILHLSIHFFHHENVQGERLSLIQRSTIVALHSLNIRNDVIARLTRCDQRTIQHWVAYYNDHQCLEEEPRSGRP